MQDLLSQAIQTALTGDWEKAIALNQEILEQDQDNIDTLNRLAFAFLSSGNKKEAKKTYERVLELDMKNPIALRNLKRLHDPQSKKIMISLNNLFIEEPGKTKLIDLLNIADKKILAPLRSGEQIDIIIKRNKIFAIDTNKQYIGMLPDDICQRLIKFMQGGNTYEAYVKSIENNRVCVFIKETKRAKKFKDQPSFASTEGQKLTIDKKRR